MLRGPQRVQLYSIISAGSEKDKGSIWGGGGGSAAQTWSIMAIVINPDQQKWLFTTSQQHEGYLDAY